ncbi:MAG: hypothetical protein SFV20_01145 [Sphingopyxis sp.]|nr:hypothetical protein [Sphingopyxis sp.]
MAELHSDVVGAPLRRHKLQPTIILGLFVGMLLAVLAFSQAAASVGLTINSLRPLGGAFFSSRSNQDRLIVDLFSKAGRVSAKQLIAGGQTALPHAPLNGRSLWLVGTGMEMQGNRDGALRAMRQATKISRRDSSVQLWLGTDQLKRGRIAPALRHFDLMIRANRDASGVIIPRMAQVIAAPEGRQFLQPYLRASTPWIGDLLRSAVETLPRAAPLASLLLENNGPAPAVAGVEATYARLIERLIEEGAYRQALLVYPKLPDANPTSLRTVNGLVDGKVDAAYPPFSWQFPAGATQGGSFIGINDAVGLDVYADAGTVGIAATKLVVPGAHNRLQWRVAERSANLQAEANWSATCLLGSSAGRLIRSVNLMTDNVALGRPMSLDLPANCELIRFDVRVAGGIGRVPSNLVLTELRLVRASAP